MITLYKIDTKGKIREWTIEVEGGSYRTIYGEKNGQLVTTEWTAVEPKNIGKKNETNVEEQAILEAKAIIKKQREKGYSEKPEKKTGDVMLAKNYDDYRDKIVFPVFCQPKLDGIRCYINKDGMFTRNHKPVIPCPHIFEELQYFFKNYPTTTLDGELYNPTLKENFNEICSLVKKTKPTDEDIRESKEKIQYWVYDMNRGDGSKFETRATFLMDAIVKNDYVKVLETKKVENQIQLDSLYEKYLAEGNEGQMVRLDTPYEEKRSKNLLKRKEFQDDEFTILDIIPGLGNKSSMAGSIITQTKSGEQFNSNIKMDWTQLSDLLINKDKYIGTICTIKYFNLTPDKKVPRFPYVIKLHLNEKL